jgi:KipI family sensor histidine kinase inhibitor
MIKNIINLGDSAIYCDFGSEVNREINSQVINYFKNLQKNKISGITNITPSYNKLIISFDLTQINYEKLKEKILKIKLENFDKESKNIIKVPVCVDEEFSLDLSRLSENLKISIDKILNSFFNKKYFCYMTGFVAGMPFLGDINKDIRFKRLETPRIKVPKGSIGITEQFCNIYTFESPGGWNIIGNTPIKVFDKFNNSRPAKINPGDTVEFYKISKSEYLNWDE